jgi:hypothetical protein
MFHCGTVGAGAELTNNQNSGINSVSRVVKHGGGGAEF